MSGDGPESVPTSADPRSHRPTKKRALTPLSSQAASLDALFAKPDQDIRIPASIAGALVRSGANRPAPPEIVTNVQGSSAGAGSGEFHVYKASRRREYERLREMDEQVKNEKGQETFEKDRAEMLKRDDEKTKKNREKREKMKARRAKKGKGGGGGDAETAKTVKGTNSVGLSRRDISDQRPEGSEPPQENGTEAPSAAPAAQPTGLVIHDDD